MNDNAVKTLYPHNIIFLVALTLTLVYGAFWVGRNVAFQNPISVRLKSPFVVSGNPKPTFPPTADPKSTHAPEPTTRPVSVESGGPQAVLAKKETPWDLDALVDFVHFVETGRGTAPHGSHKGAGERVKMKMMSDFLPRGYEMKPTQAMLTKLAILMSEQLGHLRKPALKAHFGVDTSKDLTFDQVHKAIDRLENSGSFGEVLRENALEEIGQQKLL